MSSSSNRTPTTGTRAKPWSTVFLLQGALFLTTFLAYLPALDAGFIWDDDQHISENPTLTSVNGLGGLRKIWLDLKATPQYYPLVHSSFWVEYQLWGSRPLGYHVVNILLHGANAILVWRALQMMGFPYAGLAAALFALHPVHVESVAWVTERKNLLSGFFYLLSLIAYFRFSPLEDGGKPYRSRLAYVVSLGLFLCALFSKTITCSLPAAIMLIRWWKGRLRWADAAFLAPMFLMGIVFGLTTASLERTHVGALGQEWNLSLLERSLIAGRALWFYASKLVWPLELSFIYPRWIVNAGDWWRYLPALSFLILLCFLWVFSRSVGRGPLTAVLFFAGTLFPALGFINVYPMLFSFVADHFQYLASLGGLALLSVLLEAPFRYYQWPSAAFFERVFCGTILALLFIATWRQSSIYKNPVTLWNDTLRKNPQAWMAHENLGTVYAQQGRLENAINEYQEALHLRPDNPDAHYDLGIALAKRGDFNSAIHQFEEALKLRTEFPEAYYNLGLTYYQKTEFHQAVAALSRALPFRREDPEIHRVLAMALLRSGKFEDAKPPLSETVRLRPDWSAAFNDFAWTLATHPDSPEWGPGRAVELAERACQGTRFSDPNLLDTLAASYASARRFEDAVRTAQRALELAASGKQDSLASVLRSRLVLYQSRKQFVENR